MKDSDARLTTIRLWDLPVRLFHWLLAILLVAAYASASTGRIDLHMKIGLAILTLVIFRLLWGLFGSRSARFSDFVPDPAALRAYLAGLASPRPSRWPGHNPLGGLAVLVLLGLVLLQAGLGLFIQDVDFIYAAPLSGWVEYDTARAAAKWHDRVFNILLAAVVLHLLAVLYYALRKRENLVGPMITGRKQVAAGEADRADGSLLRALLLFAVALAAVGWIATRG